MLSKARIYAAWATSIAAGIFSLLAAERFGESIGVPTSFDVDAYTVSDRWSDYEVSSITTAFGWGTNILAVLAGVVVWHLVQQRRFTPEGRADFLSFLTAASILIVGGVPHWLTFADTEGWTGTLGNVLSLGLFALAAYAGYKLNGQLKSEKGRQ